MAFHIRREPRERYAVDQPLIGTRGDLVIADTAGIRRLAARMNILREPGSPSIQAGEIGALGLLHEVGHLLIARYEAERRPGRSGPRWTTSRTGWVRRGPPARPIRRGVPGHRRRARDPRPPPRGVAPDSRLQREPRGRPDPRADRRQGAGGRDSLSRRDGPARVDVRRWTTGRWRGGVAARTLAYAGPSRTDIAGRPAPIHPGQLGRHPRQRPSTR